MSKGRQTQTTTVPAWQKKAYEELYAEGRKAMNRQFTPYTGEAVAPFTKDTQAALDNIYAMGGESRLTNPVENLINISNRNMSAAGPSSVGMTNPYLQVQTDRDDIRDINAATTASGMSNYDNPYTTQVIDRSIADLNRARQIGNITDQDAAIAANAFSGDRRGVMEAERDRAFYDAVGDVSADLRSRGYESAANLAQGDVSRNMEAQGLMSDFDKQIALNNSLLNQQGNQFNLDFAKSQAELDQQYQDNLMANNQFNAEMQDNIANRAAEINNIILNNQYKANAGLMGAGQFQQELDQAQLDFDMSEFEREQNQFAQNLGLMTSAYSGVPMMPTTTMTKKTGMGDVLGTLAQIGGAMATGGAFGAGGLFGSDRRMKTNIKKLGKNNGYNIYSWDWNDVAKSYGWDKKYPSNIGVMAQEVAHIPNAVIEDENGHLLVNYGALV